MTNPQLLIKRPHLILAIIITILTFILLSYAAANDWFREKPLPDIKVQPVIAEPALQNKQATEL